MGKGEREEGIAFHEEASNEDYSIFPGDTEVHQHRSPL